MTVRRLLLIPEKPDFRAGLTADFPLRTLLSRGSNDRDPPLHHWYSIADARRSG